VVLVDPGPDVPAHQEALMQAIGPAEVQAILVTHAHRDHTELVPQIAEVTGAPVLAFGPPHAGRSSAMERLAQSGRAGGGEGVDGGFHPDDTLADGDTLDVDGITLTVLHTPGHFPGHLSFEVGETLLSGDHVMDWSTTLISPPEGDVAAFLNSCERLLTRDHTTFLPGHGDPVTAPKPRLEHLIEHRKARERQILAVLAKTSGSPETIAREVYTDIAPALLPAAARNVLAHLVDLAERGLVQAEPELAWDAEFSRR
jgi:glyoxylase-like metal-dependent hydrolase (beta-lactamase superfamily II)